MKILVGKVISKKMDKTATVAVERIVVHSLYRKRFKKIKKYHVHDERGTKIGQVVRFVASKPYSKLKRWQIIEMETSRKQGEEKRLKKLENAQTKKGGKRGKRKPEKSA